MPADDLAAGRPDGACGEDELTFFQRQDVTPHDPRGLHPGGEANDADDQDKHAALRAKPGVQRLTEQRHSKQGQRQDGKRKHQVSKAHQHEVEALEVTGKHTDGRADKECEAHGGPAHGHGHAPACDHLGENVSPQLVGAKGMRPADLASLDCFVVPQGVVDRPPVLVADVERFGVYVPQERSQENADGDKEQEAAAKHRPLVFAELIPHVAPLAAWGLLRLLVGQSAEGFHLFRGGGLISHSGSSGQAGRRECRR